MYFKILVPLDGSHLAEQALPVAQALARRCRADIEFLTVIPAGEVDAAAEGYGGADRYLSATAELTGTYRGQINRNVLVGNAPSRIVDFARSQGVDLIVMATHGRTGLIRELLGSVTDRVILASPSPVLVVNGGSAPASGIGEVEIDNIIIPLDGSELAETALEHGEALAKAFGADVVLLRVAKATATKFERSLAEHYLAGITTCFEGDGSNVTRRVVSGAPVESVIAASGSLHNSLIVMSTRGASGFRRRLHGSVADQVVRGASVPTMVVPPVATLTGRCMD